MNFKWGEALTISNRIHLDEHVVFSEPNFIQIIPSRPEVQEARPADLGPRSSANGLVPNDPLFRDRFSAQSQTPV